MEKRDREDAAVNEYALSVSRVGNFPYTCSAIVLHPEHARTHFHLIYATRNQRGIDVFKEAEKQAMNVQEAGRARVAQRRRIEKTGQLDLLSKRDLHDSRHYESLRERYLQKMSNVLRKALEQRGRLLYDDAWKLVSSNPLTWESDLKQWIADERVSVVGLAPRQRVPRLGSGHILVSPKG